MHVHFVNSWLGGCITEMQSGKTSMPGKVVFLVLWNVGRSMWASNSNMKHQVTRERERTPEKLTTSHLARRFGVQAGTLLNRLIGRGFIEVKNGRKCLTAHGKEAGGEEITRRSRGRFIVWPQDLLLKF